MNPTGLSLWSITASPGKKREKGSNRLQIDAYAVMTMPRTELLQVRLRRDELAALDRVARWRGLTRSALVRAWIAQASGARAPISRERGGADGFEEFDGAWARAQDGVVRSSSSWP
jgi:Ribbon-helix-helix protein, copG family